MTKSLGIMGCMAVFIPLLSQSNPSIVKKLRGSQMFPSTTQSPPQQPSGASSQNSKIKQAEVTFAYAADSGTALLTLGDPQPLARGFDRAVCSKGSFEVKLVSKQKGTSGSGSTSFAGGAGDKFAIVNGKLSDEYGYCLLANYDYLSGKQALSVTRRNGQCELGLRARIPSLENRQLAACSLLATLGGSAHLLAVEYQRREKNLLAALVLLTPSGVFTETLPATLGGNSAWRVDDEGEFNGKYILPMFALADSNGRIEFAIDWLGAEGDDLTLYRTSAPGRLEKVVEGYRYQSH
jgi:hypothetical protein